MKWIVSIVVAVFSLQAQAEANWLERSVRWLEDSLPEDVSVNYSRNRLRFDGCKQQTYQMQMNAALSEPLTLESSIEYNRERLRQGLGDHRAEYFAVSVMPRYQLNHDLSVGMGLAYESAADVQLSTGQDVRFGAARSFILSSKATGLAQGHWWEMTLARHDRSDANMAALTASGAPNLSENAFNLSYQGSF